MSLARLRRLLSLLWVVFVAAALHPARAQLLQSGNGIGLFAWGDESPTAQQLWQITKSDSYSPLTAVSRLRLLHQNATIYSFDHQDHFPALASQLYHPDYVTDPTTFYSPGDSNDPPTTIVGDVPDAPDSAAISFDYPGAGQSTGGNPSSLLFVDNTDANHAGLGRAAVYFDGRTTFLPSSPHPLGTIHTTLRPSTPATFRPAGQPAQPYNLPIPPGTVGDTESGAHRAVIALHSAPDASTAAAFAEKGWGAVNVASASGSTFLVFPELRLTGLPAPSTTAVSVYAAFTARLARSGAGPIDNASMGHYLLFSDFDGATTRAQTFVALTEIGPVTLAPTVIFEHRPLAPGEPGYIPGAQTALLRGIVRLEIDVPAMTYGTLAFSTSGSTYQRLAPGETPQSQLASRVESTWATTPSVEQVRLRVPPGVDVEYVGYALPDDLLRACRLGDWDLDDDVDGIDRTEFIIARGGPLISANYIEPSLRQLATFDSDGDGDIDCTDHAAFRDAWSGAGTAPSYPPCDQDDDADGVGNVEDECAATPPGTVVDERGCPRGDSTADGAIGADDLPALIDCLFGPARPPMPLSPLVPAACTAWFDLDEDQDVDSIDVAHWQRLATP